jgi:hypothetical protein
MGCVLSGLVVFGVASSVLSATVSGQSLADVARKEQGTPGRDFGGGEGQDPQQWQPT